MPSTKTNTDKPFSASCGGLTPFLLSIILVIIKVTWAPGMPWVVALLPVILYLVIVIIFLILMVSLLGASKITKR